MKSTLLIAAILSAAACASCVSPSGRSPFVTDVVGVREKHLDAEFWARRVSDRTLLTPAQIRARNERLFAENPFMCDLHALSASLPADSVRSRVQAMSKPSRVTLYHPGGVEVSATDYQRYGAALALDATPDTCALQWGLVVRRSSLRTYPTWDPVFRTRTYSEIDRFQETAAFTGQPVAVLHRSADGRWCFVQTYSYGAWMAAGDIAFGDRQTVLSYASTRDVLVVTGAKAFTNSDPLNPEVSELQLDMGTTLPLLGPAEVQHDVSGQNPYTCFAVRVPVRGGDGQLLFKAALVARSQPVHPGFLRFTRRNVIRRAFALLGERYGWGHANNARDCSGLVSDVYRTFGILMPRNSRQQGQPDEDDRVRFGEDTPTKQKLQALRSLEPGDVLHIPGHVMMYIGTYRGEPFIIHDVNGLRYRTPQGEMYRGVLGGVSVTPLKPLLLSSSASYVERLYAIKRVWR